MTALMGYSKACMEIILLNYVTKSNMFSLKYVIYVLKTWGYIIMEIMLHLINLSD